MEDYQLTTFAAGDELDNVDYAHVADCKAYTATAMFYDAVASDCERTDITSQVYNGLRKHYKEESIN